jgi:hypothetical protein
VKDVDITIVRCRCISFELSLWMLDAGSSGCFESTDFVSASMKRSVSVQNSGFTTVGSESDQGRGL